MAGAAGSPEAAARAAAKSRWQKAVVTHSPAHRATLSLSQPRAGLSWVDVVKLAKNAQDRQRTSTIASSVKWQTLRGSVGSVRARGESSPTHGMSKVSTYVLEALQGAKTQDPDTYEFIKMLLESGDPEAIAQAEVLLIRHGRGRSEKVQGLPEVHATQKSLSVLHPVERGREYPRPDKLENLLEIISTTKGYQSFMQFLQSEYSQENLLFWSAVEDLKTAAAAAAAAQVERDIDLRPEARRVYDKYIAPNAAQQVNLSAKVSNGYIKEIKDPFLSPERLFFICEAAQNEVLAMVQKDSFSRYMKSEGYITLKFQVMTAANKS